MLESIFYGSVFLVSILFSAVYVFMWHKHFNVNFTIVFTLVPIACLGYLMSGQAWTVEEMKLALKVIYVGGCFLQLFILFSVFSLCKIPIVKTVRIALFVICALLYISVLTIGYLPYFYRSISMDVIGKTKVLTKEYGFMHTVVYAWIILLFMASMIAIIYSWLKKKQVPRKIISLLVIPDVICVFSFFVGRRLISQIDFVPLGYVVAQFVFLLIAYRVNLYDVGETVIDSMVQEREIGYISFDFKYRYLGSNETAKLLVPQLKELAVDEELGYKPAERKIRHFLDGFQKNPENCQFTFMYHLDKDDGEEAKRIVEQETEEKDAKRKENGPQEAGQEETDQDHSVSRIDAAQEDRIYNVNVNYLYEGTHKRGYIVTFTDDTQNRKYIQLIDSYNENLKAEVEEKTKHIVEMHDNLIMSLAMMVESRDNSTGGHIKRTSEGVRILVEEITKEGKLSLSPEFCKDVVKAAPMHDLGKIAVDDRILRKEGRFTDDEYDQMKHHAAEGARVIHEILLHTDDESFKTIAENVAHYHHERWDGSGYPEGKSGEEIPLEARIMAIADVYDALVSKRVYKEAFSFEKADAIIMEGMGTQFDPSLESAYVKARPRLEQYYQALK